MRALTAPPAVHDGGSGARAGDVRLSPVAAAPVAFEVVVAGAGPGGAARAFTITGPDAATGATRTSEHRLREPTHHAYLDLFAELAGRFGGRLPRNRRASETPTFAASYQALLTENLSPDVRCGWGDPAVLRVAGAPGTGEGDWYYLLATSNDAPDSFPIARSRDLHAWSLVGFVFPRGAKPSWTADGERIGDYWAPEMHRVGGEFRVYFAARERDGHALSIGMAASPRPDGPFVAMDAPLLRGGVIDPHVVVDDEGAAFLFWKEDANGVWPDRLGALLHAHGRLVAELFPAAEDRVTASLMATLWPWARTLEPMERFFVQHAFVEAVSAGFAAFVERLATAREREPDAGVRAAIRGVLDAMRTPVHAQRLAPDGRSLVGDRTTVLENDREWEAHLVEGVWVARHGARWYLFYAGNDFSTAQYGVGVAVADSPLGPYRKMAGPLLRSTAEWSGPGHPSVADGPDGRPCLFLHAFRPGVAGYNAFRALLMVPIAYEPDRVVLR